MNSSTDTPAEAAIRFDGIHVIYDGVCVLDVESLRIAPRERVFLLGRSGSGKTTLMRVVKGRVRPSSGDSVVFGQNPAIEARAQHRQIQRRIAMIDQDFHLIPRMPVIDNVLIGALGRVNPWKSLFGWYPAEEWDKAETILKEVGLEKLADRRVDTLSGGQRQRAAIARALMQEADVILADEPVSALDPELAEDALELLVECVERRDVTLVVSLHQPALAKRFATRLIGLYDGKIIYDGPPEELTPEASRLVYRDPANPQSKQSGNAHEPTTETVAKTASPPHLRVID